MMPSTSSNENNTTYKGSQSQEDPEMNLAYIKTPDCWVKLLQLVIGIILLALWTPTWFTVFVGLFFVQTCAWLWIHVFELPKKFAGFQQWALVELVTISGASLIFAICTILLFTYSYIPAGIFSLQNTVAYAAESYFLLKHAKHKETYERVGTTTPLISA